MQIDEKLLSALNVNLFLFFPSAPLFHAMNFCEKNFSIWIKSDFLMNFLKPENPILLRSTRAADHSIDMLRVVTWIQERVTSGLTYLACFASVNLAS